MQKKHKKGLEVWPTAFLTLNFINSYWESIRPWGMWDGIDWIKSFFCKLICYFEKFWWTCLARGLLKTVMQTVVSVTSKVIPVLWNDKRLYLTLSNILIQMHVVLTTICHIFHGLHPLYRILSILLQSCADEKFKQFTAQHITDIQGRNILKKASIETWAMNSGLNR